TSPRGAACWRRGSRRSKPHPGWYSSRDWPSAWPCSASTYSAIRFVTSRIRASAAASASRGARKGAIAMPMRCSRLARLTACAIAAILALALLAPSAPAQEKPRPGGILNWFDYGDPGRLDVHAESPLVVQQATAGIYSGLLQYDPDDPSKITGDLAEKWTTSPDGKTYTFHLRRNVKW